MQLTGNTSIRGSLQAAACMLLAAGPAGAAASGSTVDASALIYGEQNGVNVVEPIVRVTRLFANGHSLSAQGGVDVITGASPTGAAPSGVTHTVTTPSGNAQTQSAEQVPAHHFQDLRGVLDLAWQGPFGVFTPALGAHASREKDYQSLGANGTLAVDLFHRRTTLTGGYGVNEDRVFPVGGIPAPLVAPPTVVSAGGTGEERALPVAAAAEAVPPAGSASAPKHVFTALAGISQVVTRRWLLGLTATRTLEQGYLTEPYKVLSVVDPTSGIEVGQLTESRPEARVRTDVLVTSVYHFGQDVLHVGYRYYWDDWKVRSHTIDLKLRHDLPNAAWVQPLVRYYAQSSASLYRWGLVQGEPLPDFASADTRLGPLHSLTLGGTVGFRVQDKPGEWTIRAQYIVQFGNGSPSDAVGIQRGYDLFPTENIGALTVGYSYAF